jgi:hypothetical protein
VTAAELSENSPPPHRLCPDASEGAAMRRDLIKWMLIVIGIPILCTLALRLFVAPLIN